MKRFLCLLRGHVQGGAVLFAYTKTPANVAQWPDRRGPTRIRIIGAECLRCGRVVASSAAEQVAAARELVEGLTGGQ